MAQVTQETVNQTLAIADGNQPDYVIADSRRIRDLVCDIWPDLVISDNDARLFWEWRSREWDATWLSLSDDNENAVSVITDWFQRWVDRACDPEPDPDGDVSTDDLSY